MAESDVIDPHKELRLKKLQLNAIYEFSSALRSDSSADDILRFFFSIMMGPLGLTRAFYFDKKKRQFNKKGFPLTVEEKDDLQKNLKTNVLPFSCQRVAEMDGQRLKVKELLLEKQIHHLINISENKRETVILGLGEKFNREPLTSEDKEFIFFLSQFAVIALNNVFNIQQLLEKKKMEYEISIAREIQQSLLPQELPGAARFDIAVIYEPIREVGGDYYDFFSRKKNSLAVLLADVEGKGLSSALLAASTQAIFHTMNELYLFSSAKFIQKANALISSLTRGQRFITLLWMLLDDEAKNVTYVNAGHCTPYLISDSHVTPLTQGGLFMGFSPSAVYEQETIPMKRGDIIVAYTDGVTEVQSAEGKEFGEQTLVDFVRSERKLPAATILDKLYKKIKSFSHKEKFRDDFTVLLIKAK